jgi:hypothetical protein
MPLKDRENSPEREKTYVFMLQVISYFKIAPLQRHTLVVIGRTSTSLHLSVQTCEGSVRHIDMHGLYAVKTNEHLPMKDPVRVSAP